MSNTNKYARLLWGVGLLLIAIFCYVLLHGTERLYIFSFLPKFDFISINFISPLRGNLAEQLPFFFSNKLIIGYLVDFLWFVSFYLIVSHYYCGKLVYKLLVVLGIGILSECSQLLNPTLGTFDYFDIMLYFFITLLFGLYEWEAR